MNLYYDTVAAQTDGLLPVFQIVIFVTFYLVDNWEIDKFYEPFFRLPDVFLRVETFLAVGIARLDTVVILGFFLEVHVCVG